jgi:hypothetical protein
MSTTVAPPNESTPAICVKPTIVNSLRGAVPTIESLSPSLNFCLRAVDASIVTSSAAWGLRPSLIVNASKLGGDRGDEVRRAALPDALAVLAEHGADVEDRAGRALNAVLLAHLPQDGGRDGRLRAAVVRRVDRLGRRDRRVGALRRLGEDAVERAVDRVGEDVRAGDERDAERDCQRGEHQPELAGEQPAKRDLPH